MKLSEAVGKRVENLLAERNMTQYQLYKNGGIPCSTISVTVDGKYKTVKLDTIYQIVATLGKYNIEPDAGFVAIRIMIPPLAPIQLGQ